MLKLLIIFNPNAGSCRALKYLPLIKDYLRKNNLKFELIQTDSSGHAKSIVKKTNFKNYAAVIAAGGDGTLFEVINGLMSHQVENRIPFGVIPVGTGNAFSRDLGLMPNDWQKGIDTILKNKIKPIDIGLAKTASESFYFLNIIGMGFAANVGQTTLKIKKLGQSAYTFATLWETMKLKKNPIKLTLTDKNDQQEVIDEPLVFVEVANSRYTGTSFLIAPEAKIDDGLLDVIILKKISRPKLLTLFPTIYSGKHINYKEVETRQVKSISIETPVPMPLMPDGEFIGDTPVSINCLPHGLQLYSND